MAYHQGRLIDHVHLRVSDLGRSKVFYGAILESIGLGDACGETDECFYADELYIDQADDYVSRIHLAFRANDRETVARFHKVAVENGGTDNGVPGERAYRSQYYAAFVLDPDGNNIEVVCDAPTQRSAESVLVERLPD